MIDRDNFTGIVLGVFFVCVMIVVGVVGSVISYRYQVEQTKIIQKEKSERGHWLWGHATDRLKARDQ
jgi:hypothetical protein